jgi:uncharacterized protein with PQ loop repeat
MPFDPSLIQIVGGLTVASSLLVKPIGLPHQIVENYKRKSTQGVSLPNHAIGFFAYACWTFYGYLNFDWVLIYGQFLGVITEGIVVIQILSYRSPKNA